MNIWNWGSFERYYHWIVVFFSLVLFIPYLGARDLWAPVEPRYAEIARVMFAKGDWLVPTVNADLYTDKPILYFWLVLLASKLAGSVGEFTVRLPAALSAVGLVLTVYFLGRDFFNRRTGFMAALICATSARVIWEARWAHTDMLLTFFLTLSLYCFARTLLRIGRKREILLSYAFIALATLTKGLIGIVLPGLIVLIFITLRGEWRSLLKLRLLSGVLIFLLLAAPWFAAVAYLTDGKWLADFIWIHHFQRYTAGAGHRQPFYYYLTTLPADFLPWTFFAMPAVLFYCRRWKGLFEPVTMFFLLWFSVIFVFFSLSDTKRDLYLLPAFPPIAIFVACFFDNLLKGEIFDARPFRWLGYCLFATLAIGGLIAPFAAVFFEKQALGISLAASVVLLAGGLMGLSATHARKPHMVFACTVLTVALLAVNTTIWILPYVDRYKSPRGFAATINRIVPETEPLFIYSDRMNQLNFYTRREAIPVISSPTEVKTLLTKIKSAYLLVEERHMKNFDSAEKMTVLAEADVGSKHWRIVRVTGQT